MHLSNGASNRHAHGTSDRRFVTSCAWCDRIRVEGTWLERDLALSRLRRRPQPEPLFTYGICERCLEPLLGHREHAGDPDSEEPRSAKPERPGATVGL